MNLKRKEIVFNIAIWAIISLIVLIILPDFESKSFLKIRSFTVLVSTITIFGLPVFYLNIFSFIPTFLEKKNYLEYIRGISFLVFVYGVAGAVAHFMIQQLILGFSVLEKPQLLVAIPLIFIAANLLFVLPASFLYYLIKNIIFKHKITSVSEVGFHLFFGGVFWILLYTLGVQHIDIHAHPAYFFITIFYCCWLWGFTMAVFYLNAFYGIPNFLAKKKTGKYLLFLVGVIFIAVIIDGLLFTFVPNFNLVLGKKLIEPYVMLSLKIKLFLIVPISFLYRFSKDWVRNLEIKKKLIESELAHLKSQINPHFLFNTLNSLYAQSLEENSPMTSEGIAKLSNLMRYSLHYSQEKFISLEKEIDYLNDYVALQKGRLPTHINKNVQFEVNGNVKHFIIAPMLLITFIENTFQHGISMDENCFINIKLLTEGNKIVLNTNNRILNKITEGNSLGIENTIKRMDIIYPDKYTLETNISDNQYNLKLELILG